jgi:hypothetical protein
MVPSDSPALWVLASSCIQLVLLHLVVGQVYSFSGKKEDVSSLITKAGHRPKQSAVPSGATFNAHLFRSPANDGAWISIAEFFDWYGRPQDPQDVDLEVHQQLSASVYDALVYYITDAKVANVDVRQ